MKGLKRVGVMALAFLGAAVSLGAASLYQGLPDTAFNRRLQPGDGWELEPQRLAEIPTWRVFGERRLMTQSYGGQGFDLVSSGFGAVTGLGAYGALGVSYQQSELSNVEVRSDVLPGEFQYVSGAWGRRWEAGWSAGIAAGGGSIPSAVNGRNAQHWGAGLGRQIGKQRLGAFGTWEESSKLWVGGANMDGPLFWGQGYHLRVLSPEGEAVRWDLGLDILKGFGVHLNVTDQTRALLGLGWSRPWDPEDGKFGFQTQASYSAEVGLLGSVGISWGWTRLNWDFGTLISQYQLSLQGLDKSKKPSQEKPKDEAPEANSAEN